jgi:hypothetical protein
VRAIAGLLPKTDENIGFGGHRPLARPMLREVEVEL